MSLIRNQKVRDLELPPRLQLKRTSNQDQERLPNYPTRRKSNPRVTLIDIEVTEQSILTPKEPVSKRVVEEKVDPKAVKSAKSRQASEKPNKAEVKPKDAKPLVSDQEEPNEVEEPTKDKSSQVKDAKDKKSESKDAKDKKSEPTAPKDANEVKKTEVKEAKKPEVKDAKESKKPEVKDAKEAKKSEVNEAKKAEVKDAKEAKKPEVKDAKEKPPAPKEVKDAKSRQASAKPLAEDKQVDKPVLKSRSKSSSKHDGVSKIPVPKRAVKAKTDSALQEIAKNTHQLHTLHARAKRMGIIKTNSMGNPPDAAGRTEAKLPDIEAKSEASLKAEYELERQERSKLERSNADLHQQVAILQKRLLKEQEKTKSFPKVTSVVPTSLEVIITNLGKYSLAISISKESRRGA